MSKKTETPAVDGSPVSTEQATVESGSPAFIQELLEKGSTIITASSREELAEMVNDIPAGCRYMSGAVGYNPENGLFSLRLDITNS